MNQSVEQQITIVLRSIEWKGQGLASSGALAGVSVASDPGGMRASIIVQIGEGGGKDIDDLRQSIEKAVGAIAGISSVSVVFTAHKEAGKTQARQQINLPRVKHVVAVVSGKGGVGKSTVAANLAVACAIKGLKTGLVDADVYGPSIPKMFGVSEKPLVGDDKKMTPIVRYGVSLMSIGFLVPEESPMIWRGPMVHSAITQLFRDVDWGDLDILIVDMPPGTGDAHLTLVQKIQLSGAVVVSTPQDVALCDARKGIAMLQRVDVPIIGLIENMSHFVCPHCRECSDIFGCGGAKAEAERQKIPLLGEIPLDISIRRHSDEGTVLAVSDPGGAITAVYSEIAERMWRSLA